MKLGIIIPNYCTALHHISMVEQTVRSIAQYEPELLSRTYIVDDGSPLPNKYELLSEISSEHGCKLAFKKANTGYSSTVNHGLKHLFLKGCNVALTLNSDCELVSPFQRQLQQIFNFDARISVVGGRLLYPNGKIQSAGQTVPKAGGVIEHSKHEKPGDTPLSGTPRYVHSVTGAMQFFRMDAGLYDESFPMAYEDVEFCLRQWNTGRRVFYQPQIQAIHREGGTRGRFPAAGELVSIEKFDKVRGETDINHHHYLINAMNSEIAIHTQQSANPQ